MPGARRRFLRRKAGVEKALDNGPHALAHLDDAQGRVKAHGPLALRVLDRWMQEADAGKARQPFYKAVESLFLKIKLKFAGGGVMLYSGMPERRAKCGRW
jgi:hypothetical protein